MKLFRFLLPLTMALGLAVSPLMAQLRGPINRYDEELNERDFNALREFLNSKRTLDLQDKSCNLTISGDVRAKWRNLRQITERARITENFNVVDRFDQPFPNNYYTTAFNFRLDYISDKAWGVAHVGYDNAAGVEQGLGEKGTFDYEKYAEQQALENGFSTTNSVAIPVMPVPFIARFDPKGWQGSGSRGDLNLRKAYVGINLMDCYDVRIDLEVGRRNLYNVFDSRVQFLSRFDGALLKTSYSPGCFFDEAYLNAAAFVVDSRVNHYAWLFETGVLDIMNSAVDVKYSFIDWNKRGDNRYKIRNPPGFRFKVSQLTLSYCFTPEFLQMRTKMYGAVLYNHQKTNYDVVWIDFKDPVAKTGPFVTSRFNLPDRRFAWYVGFTIGKPCKAGDWSLDVQYQYVEAFALPDRDGSGIGNGNFINSRILAAGRGNTNFHGYRIEGLYNFTDNLAVNANWEQSHNLETLLGGKNSYSAFEMEALYAF